MNIRVPSHLKKRFNSLKKLNILDDLPEPWAKPNYIAVGGLTDVGFLDNSDLLICISSDGRGVINCLKGEKVARDYDRDFVYDTGNLLVMGIGSMAGQYVRTARLAGGGLASTTHDGWSVELHPFAFPKSQLFVSPPGQTMLWTHHNEEMQLSKLGGFVTELRAFGFSPTGHSFVIATSSDVTVYTRS